MSQQVAIRRLRDEIADTKVRVDQIKAVQLPTQGAPCTLLYRNNANSLEWIGRVELVNDVIAALPGTVTGPPADDPGDLTLLFNNRLV